MIPGAAPVLGSPGLGVAITDAEVIGGVIQQSQTSFTQFGVSTLLFTGDIGGAVAIPPETWDDATLWSDAAVWSEGGAVGTEQWDDGIPWDDDLRWNLAPPIEMGRSTTTPAIQQLISVAAPLTAVIAHNALPPAQSLAGLEVFRASTISGGRPAAQSAAGLVNVWIGTVAQAASAPSQSAAGVLGFIGTAAMQVRPATQLTFAESGDAIAGGIIQSARSSTRQSAGALIFSGSAAQAPVAGFTTVNGVMQLLGTIEQSGELSTQDLEVLMTFIMGVVQTTEGLPSQSLSGFWFQDSTIAQIGPRTRQSAFGIHLPQIVGAGDQRFQGPLSQLAIGETLDITSGTVAQALAGATTSAGGLLTFQGLAAQLSPRATQLINAVLPELLVLERINARIEFQPAVSSSGIIVRSVDGMATGKAFVDNDNLVWLRGATKARAGTPIAAGLAQLTGVRNRDGNLVTGQAWPTIMFYTGANGDWVAQIDDAADLVKNEVYWAVIDLDAGDGIKGHWEVPFVARTRVS